MLYVYFALLTVFSKYTKFPHFFPLNKYKNYKKDPKHYKDQKSLIVIFGVLFAIFGIFFCIFLGEKPLGNFCIFEGIFDFR
jgi:hypothetical protein